MPIVRRFAETTPVIAPDVFLAENASVIGDVVIGPGSSIWYGTVVRGDVMPIRIGRATSIQDNSVIHVDSGGWGTTVGDGVTVGHRVVLHGCTIGNGALIGIGATVMNGAEVGEGALIGAGSLVTEGMKIPGGMLALGTPCRVKRPLTDEEKAHLRESAAHYVELAQDHAAEEAAAGAPRRADR